MRPESKLLPYQHLMIEHIKKNPFCALWVGMGAGKTAATLTALAHMMAEFEVGRTLVIAPLRVSRKVWSDEIREWEHLQHLEICNMHGALTARRDKIQRTADIHTINRDNLVWLIKTHAKKKNGKVVIENWPWKTVVIDEARSFQNANSHRFKWLKKLRDDGHVERIIQLTGTPATNGLMGLWAQLYLLDQGKRLGKTISWYRNNYFERSFHNQHVYNIKPDSERLIFRRVADICLTLKPEDCKGLPDVVYNNVIIPMSPKVRDTYQSMEKDMLLELKNKKTVTAVNAGVLWNKLSQLANGFIYYAKNEYVDIHDLKLEALKEALWSIGDKTIVIYNFQADLERIKAMLNKMRQCRKPIKWRVLKTEADEIAWNEGLIDVLLLHPASAGHGLNLHKSGARNIVHFGLNPDLDLYLQVNARLFGGHRGHGHVGTIHHLVMDETIDNDIITLLANKERAQDRLLEATRRKVQQLIENEPPDTKDL